MIVPIVDRQALATVKNPDFAAYATTYVEIHEDFLRQLEETGVPLAAPDNRQTSETGPERRGHSQATYRNDGKSIYLNAISPACVACQLGIGSATYFISFMCNRSCWFCFNPNEEDYQIFSQRKRNVCKELSQIHDAGLGVQHIALTGGEPLLHKPDALAFFRDAKEKFPGVYTRLYTCGDALDAQILRDLAQVGLDEIRFSIKVGDLRHGNLEIYDKIARAKRHIRHVMVEMPVIPGTRAQMQEILVMLDQLQIFGINLLEFCFPYQNARTYRAKGLHIKNPPFRILYNYNYAGGLPVHGSEEECLALLDFASEAQLGLGVHYCSLENKLTAQVYQQNLGQSLPDSVYFSQKDYFLKSAKVFGSDVRQARRMLRRRASHTFSENEDVGYLEFHVGDIELLRPKDLEIAICSSVVERRSGGRFLRELQVALTTPRSFDRSIDV